MQSLTRDALINQLNMFLEKPVFIDPSGNFQPMSFVSRLTTTISPRDLEARVVTMLGEHGKLLTSFEDTELVFRVAKKCGLSLGKIASQNSHKDLNDVVRSIINVFGASVGPVKEETANSITEEIIEAPVPVIQPIAAPLVPVPEEVILEPEAPFVESEVTTQPTIVADQPTIVAEKIVNTNISRWKIIAGIGAAVLATAGIAYYMINAGVQQPLDAAQNIIENAGDFSEFLPGIVQNGMCKIAENSHSIIDAAVQQATQFSTALVPFGVSAIASSRISTITSPSLSPAEQSFLFGMQQVNSLDHLSLDLKRNMIAEPLSPLLSNPIIPAEPQPTSSLSSRQIAPLFVPPVKPISAVVTPQSFVEKIPPNFILNLPQAVSASSSLPIPPKVQVPVEFLPAMKDSALLNPTNFVPTVVNLSNAMANSQQRVQPVSPPQEVVEQISSPTYPVGAVAALLAAGGAGIAALLRRKQENPVAEVPDPMYSHVLEGLPLERPPVAGDRVPDPDPVPDPVPPPRPPGPLPAPQEKRSQASPPEEQPNQAEESPVVVAQDPVLDSMPPLRSPEPLPAPQEKPSQASPPMNNRARRVEKRNQGASPGSPALSSPQSPVIDSPEIKARGEGRSPVQLSENQQAALSRLEGLRGDLNKIKRLPVPEGETFNEHLEEVLENVIHVFREVRETNKRVNLQKIVDDFDEQVTQLISERRVLGIKSMEAAKARVGVLSRQLKQAKGTAILLHLDAKQKQEFKALTEECDRTLSDLNLHILGTEDLGVAKENISELEKEFFKVSLALKNFAQPLTRGPNSPASPPLPVSSPGQPWIAPNYVRPIQRNLAAAGGHGSPPVRVVSQVSNRNPFGTPPRFSLEGADKSSRPLRDGNFQTPLRGNKTSLTGNVETPQGPSSRFGD